MPNWLTEAVKQFGLTTPFIYAFATYRIFIHFDRRGVSAKAKKALADWLQPQEYDRAAVGDAILEIFNLIYTAPLFRWKAFGRSAFITFLISALLYFEIFGVSYGIAQIKGYSAEIGAVHAITGVIALPLIPNIISDYVALFVVKRFIIIGKTNTIKALLFGPLMGMLVVILFAFVRYILYLVDAALRGMSIADLMMRFVSWFDISLDVIYQRPFVFAALIVHLWLPVCGLCVAVLKMLNYFRLAVGRTQWFISRGNDHPLEAIGYVAAIIVFVTTMSVRLIF
jgi:hypothetical protein